MKLSFICFLFSALQTTASLAEVKANHDELVKQVQAKVYYCNDGDTCHLGIAESLWLNVRLAGIDAPEVANKRKKSSGQEYGNAARDYLRSQLQGKSVSVRQVDLDAYNRPVVELMLDGKLVNTLLLEQGFAEMYRGKTKRIDKNLYEAAEAKAKQDKRGIWGLANYTSPALYRQKMRN